MDRRAFGRNLAGASLALAWPLVPAQQAILRTYVGFPPGPGGFDNVARIVGEALQPLGYNAVVHNKVGAGGRIALQNLKSDPEPETNIVLSSQSPMTIFPHIYKDLQFDPLKDFAPLSKATTFDFAFAVRADSPFPSAKAYLDWARANPGAILFGIPGNGTMPHFIAETIFQRLGVAAQAITYKGTTPAIQDLLGGQVPVHFDSLSASLALHKAGKLRVLATCGQVRSTFAPDVPTLSESGIDLAMDGWCAYYAPAAMSAAQQARLSNAIGQSLGQESVRMRLAAMGMVPAPSSPAALAAFQVKELNFWGDALKNADLRKKLVA